MLRGGDYVEAARSSVRWCELAGREVKPFTIFCSRKYDHRSVLGEKRSAPTDFFLSNNKFS